MFAYREGEVLYGRDNDIRDLSQYVLRDKYTLLYGKSGIGKSSILNAAIIPVLRRHGFIPVALRLSHKSKNYLNQIHKAIETVLGPDGIREELPKLAEEESLYEYLHRHTFWDKDGNRAKLFLLFDQFEEIFTLQSDEFQKTNFYVQLASQCNDIKPDYLQASNPHSEKTNIVQSVHGQDASHADSLDDFEFELPALDSADYVEDNEIRMIFTIREDFLSEFDYYAASIPSLRNNRYFLRPINEEQAAQIILRPCPGLVNEQDAWLIISKVTNREDFTLDGNPEVIVDSAVLSLYLSRLYDARPDNGPITKSLIEQKGGEIISEFYKDAISAVSQHTADYLEESLLTGQGRRDNITVYDAKHDGHISEEELHTLVEEKKILRRFNYAGDLRIEFVHDILCNVAATHKEERRLEIQQESERQKLLKAREEERKKNKKRLIAAFSIAAIMALIVTGYIMLNVFPISEYYAGFTTREGFPVGIGPRLTDSDKAALPVHYRLTREGLLKSKPFIEVNIVNRDGANTNNILAESPAVALLEAEGNDLNASKFAAMQRQVSTLKFERDENRNILRQVAYDIEGNTLYSILYSRIMNSKTENTRMYWMTFIDHDGKTMKVRDNGLDRMRMMTTDGYPTLVQFFSESGTPQKNSRDVYGYKYNVDSEKGFCTAIVPLDEYGDSIDGEALFFEKFDSFNRWTIASKGRAVYDTNMVIYSFQNTVNYSFRERIDTLILDGKGKLTYRSELDNMGLRTFSFNGDGKLRESKEFAMTTNGSTLIRSVSLKYDKQGKIVDSTHFDSTDDVPYQRKTYRTRNDTSSIVFTGGSSLERMSLMNGPDGFCRINTTKKILDTIIIKTIYYYMLYDGTEYLVNKEELTCDKRNLIIRKIRENENGLRELSMEYEYENGICVGRHVIGLTGEIIRCPDWDEQKLCYYRLKYICNNDGVIVAQKAINEFGDVSIATYGKYEMIRKIIPGEKITQTTSSNSYNREGIGIVEVSSKPALYPQNYIQITDTNGSWYRSGLRDGDILIHDNQTSIEIARPKKGQKKYEKKTVNIVKGETGGRTYSIFFTKKELEMFNESISAL